MLAAMPDRSALTAGRWVIDPDHSRVLFAVRRRGLPPMRARFASISGLDVARHPTATFRATSTSSACGLTRFRGWLTIVGATNEVELDVHVRARPSTRRAHRAACSPALS